MKGDKPAVSAAVVQVAVALPGPEFQVTGAALVQILTILLFLSVMVNVTEPLNATVPFGGVTVAVKVTD